MRHLKRGEARGKIPIDGDSLRLGATKTELVYDPSQKLFIERAAVLVQHAEETAHGFSAGMLGNSLSKAA